MSAPVGPPGSPASPPAVIIVGGGIAGLSAAYELGRQGVRCGLIEASPRLGGVIRTDRIDRFTIDAGPDSLIVEKPAALELCAELGLASRLMPTRPPRTAFILRGGRLHPLPEASVLGIPTRLAPFVRSPLFSPAGKLRMGLEACLPRRGPMPDGDESVGAFFRRRFGREAVDYLAEPLLAGIHAGQVDRLSMRALFPRLLAVEAEHGSLIRGFRRRRRAPAPGGMFRSLPHGLEELPRALAEALPGELVRLTDPVTHLAPRTDGGYDVGLRSGRTLVAPHLILAIPADEAAGLLGGIDPQLAAECRAIPHASTATIALAYPRQGVRHPLDGSGFVVPRRERSTRVLAVTWVSSKWSGRAPDGQVLIRAFLGGARDPGRLEQTDEQLARIAQEDLAGILGVSAAPVLVRVYRWPRRSPQHEVGHLERMARIDARLARLPRLHVTGSSYRGVGIADCVADARATASRVAGRIAASRP